ncbi:ATP synthase subunit I [Shouchella patagoniensis]|uniref:ATP synthase subunit I n=1 Tax=Shouchella patagoniensis TaxID=228576 RepID=UPI000995DCCC|nr:ATP synthase subunit I [Shouchella patagoniensis]
MSEKASSHLVMKSKMKFYFLIAVLTVTVLLIGFFITPFQSIFLGLILGFSISFLNLWTTYRNAHIIGGIHAPSKWPSMIIASLGFVFRIFLVITAVWVAIQYPERFHILSVVIGLGLMYAIMMLDMIVKSFKAKEVK